MTIKIAPNIGYFINFQHFMHDIICVASACGTFLEIECRAKSDRNITVFSGCSYILTVKENGEVVISLQP